MAVKSLWKRKFVKVFRQFENKCIRFHTLNIPEQNQSWLPNCSTSLSLRSGLNLLLQIISKTAFAFHVLA